MKTSRLIVLIFFIIFFSFLQVFLQTEIIKLGYTVKQNEDTLQKLVENNQVLHYNIYALESPYRLERYVEKRKSDLKDLEPLRVQSLGPVEEKHYAGVVKEQKNTLSDHPLSLSLKKFFSGKQAEAKTIK